MNGLTKTADCLDRSTLAQSSGNALVSSGDEWFAVCFFYSAYHIVRAAILSDPVFDSQLTLSAASSHLKISDRTAARHNGRKHTGSGPREIGVNDIVKQLYPKISMEYVRLHIASVDVRYNNRLEALGAEEAVADFEHILNAYKQDDIKFQPLV